MPQPTTKRLLTEAKAGEHAADPTTPLGAALSATYASKAGVVPGVVLAKAKMPGTFVALGDSTTGVDYNSGVLWPQALQAISGRKLSLLRNAGVGGDTTAMMLARVQADVVALNPSICVFLGGTNDVLNSVPFATTQANIIATADVINAAGIEFVIGTLVPRNAHTGTSGVAAVRTLNAWIKLWAASRGYRVIDFNKALANPRSGEYAAGTFYDPVHANAAGNIIMAQTAAAVLTASGDVAYVPSIAPHEGEVDYLSSIDSGTVPRSAQLNINPLLWDLTNDFWPERWESKAVARVVTAASAGATSIEINAPITPGAYRFGTGQAQQETLTVTSVTGSASPYTANLSSPAVNPHPVAQRVDTAALTAETVSTDTRFSGSRALKIVGTAQTGAQDVATYRMPAAWAVGDKLRLVHKLALDTPTSIPASTSGTGYGVEVKLVFNGTATVAKSVTRWAYATPAGLALEFAVDATVPAGTTSVDVVATINLGGGTATIYLGEVGVWNLSTLGIASGVLPV